MGVAALAESMQLVSALHDVERRMSTLFGQRSELAGRLRKDLTVPVDTFDPVTRKGRRHHMPDWTSYFPMLEILTSALVALEGLKQSLTHRLEQLKVHQEQERIRKENAIAQGNVFA